MPLSPTSSFQVHRFSLIVPIIRRLFNRPSDLQGSVPIDIFPQNDNVFGRCLEIILFLLNYYHVSGRIVFNVFSSP